MGIYTTKAFKRLLRFMVRRRRTCRSKSRPDKIPSVNIPPGNIPPGNIPHILSEMITEPRNEYLPSETEDSTEVSPAPQCPLNNNVNDHGSERVPVQPEKHDTRKEKSRVADCESSDSIINEKYWENFGCSSDDLCDLSEERTVPQTNRQGPVALDPESLCFKD